MEAREIARLLPEVFRTTMDPGSPLYAVVGAMVALLDPVDRRLDGLDHYFDPFRAPTAMLPYLAHWVDLGWIPIAEAGGGEGVPPEQLRALIAAAPTLARSRGTRAGLEHMLRAVTRVPAIRVREADPQTRAFHLVVEVPRSEAGRVRLVDTVTRAERPAHLTHEIVMVD